MNGVRHHSMIVIACAVVMSLLGSSAWAVCSLGTSTPTCYARAGRYCSNADTTPCTTDANCPGGFCSAVIFGHATVNAGSIVITAPGLVLSTGGTGTDRTFRVHWSDNVSTTPFTGSVTADNGGLSCTVPVRVTNRNDVPPDPTKDILCSDPTYYPSYTFTVQSGPTLPNPPSQAGQSACAMSPYSDCEDQVPPHDATYPNPPLTFSDQLPAPTFVFSIASPIHSKTASARDITMQLEKNVTLNTKLRLAFARSTDNGASYLPWTDSTTNVTGPATAFVPITKIIGTGEWSSIRVAVAVSPNDFSTAGSITATATTPTIGEWGMIILSLLLLSASSVLVRQRRFALAGSGPVPLDPPPVFVPRLFLRVLAGIGVLGLVALAALVLLGQAPSTTDIVGSLCSAGILAYVVHLWAIPEVRSS